jgi:hypothetical protein
MFNVAAIVVSGSVFLMISLVIVLCIVVSVVLMVRIVNGSIGTDGEKVRNDEIH